MSVKAKSLGSAGSAADLIAISAATNATPIVITVGANSGLKTGDKLAIAGVTGNTAANGIWAATPCPTEKAVGTCATAEGQYMRYYSRGTLPYTPDKAARDCKEIRNGKWLGSPKPAVKK